MNARTTSSAASARTAGFVRRVDGQTVFAGRYQVTVKNGQVTIHDKQTGTRSSITRDLLLKTGDGDRAKLGADGNNVTVRLHDGAKVTVVASKDASGKPSIDRVVVTRGGEGIEVRNVNDDAKVGRATANGRGLDRTAPDGTTVVAGKEVDDLHYRVGGKEIEGDATKAGVSSPAGNSELTKQPAVQPRNETSGGGSGGGSGGSSSGGSSDGPSLNELERQHEKFLNEQRRLDMEAEKYAAESNKEKTRHETLMAIINNWR